MRSNLNRRGVVRLAGLAAALWIAASLAPWNGASAGTLTRIYDFCALSGCVDGQTPSSLAADSAGNLFGVTLQGGKSFKHGAAFELVPNEDRTAWSFVQIYSFCTTHGCPGGVNASGKLIADADGNLYGTAENGGLGGGTIFELMPTADPAKWTLKKLHAFCREADCPDGKSPAFGLTYAGQSSGLPYDGVSPLYGITEQGGGVSGAGVVFQLTRSGAGYREKVLHKFCSAANCADGIMPHTSLTVDADGNLYGGTQQGGASNHGTLFKLVRGTGGRWHLSVLHDFCTGTGCGGYYTNGVILNADGDLTGTAFDGGAFGGGTLFKISRDGTTTPYTVLVDFCENVGCTTGFFPEGQLVMDGSGNLFGVASEGGANLHGVVFEWDGTTFSPLYSFCVSADCSDGETPRGDLVLDGSGNLFGITEIGGGTTSGNGSGTVFEYSPSAPVRRARQSLSPNH